MLQSFPVVIHIVIACCFQINTHEINQVLDKLVQDIQQLTALVECANIHKDYSDAVQGACYLAL